MLKTAQTVAFDGDADGAEQARTAYPEDQRSGIERRRHPRVPVDGDTSDGTLKLERRSTDRRGVDRLRAETTYQTATAKQSSGIADRLNRMGLKPSRLFLLLLAIGSGGIAAYMASQNSAPAAIEPVTQTVTEVVPEARTRVLVATRPIGIGQRLTATTVEWKDWPEGAVLGDYFTFDNNPDALQEMGNAVARFDLFPGDPIREQKLVRNAEGYLSAVLETGMRGVSVTVSAESASGGFISPNDHVDVVLTRGSTIGDVSETILHNVRVLAINSQLGETGSTGDRPDDEAQQVAQFANQAIATLELDAREAEVIISATNSGRLSLVLRSMTDFAEVDNIDQRGSNQAIRISSPFWSADFNPSGQ